MNKNCKEGKVVNPKTGRCVFKNSAVLKKNKIQTGDFDISRKNEVIISCGKLKYINPKTKRCVNYSNPDIQKYIRMGYKLDDLISYTNIPDTKVVEPRNYKDIIKFTSPLGKKITSSPYIIINNKSEPESPKLSITEKNKFKNIKPEKIKTALDTDGDNYVSVKEYLDVAESTGPGEQTKGLNFKSYSQRNLGSLFILSLIKKKKGPISKIGCVPLFILCLQKNTDGIYYTRPDVVVENKLDCLEKAEIKLVSFVILNAPKKSDSLKTTDKMNILTPPNLTKLIQKCENDNKYMVVSDLTLIGSNNPRGDDSHSNVLIFDTRRKTIERFDPHGADEYILKKLINDMEENSDEDILKDLKYVSGAYFNQNMIDKELSTYFNTLLPNYTYNGVNITTPYLGPQLKTDEYSGLCVTWSCMYMVLRLLNPELSPSDVTIKMIDGTPKELKNRLLRFNKYIVNTLSEEKENLRIFK